MNNTFELNANLVPTNNTSIDHERRVVLLSESNRIGEGAFSIVYKGLKKFEPTTCYAVKKALIQSSECEKIVLIEIESYKKFIHPNILRMIDYTQEVEGNLKVTFILFPFVANALSILHSFNPSYVHQDLKPENILIDEYENPLLSDFGSVRIAHINIQSRKDELKVIEEAEQFCTASFRSPELYNPQRGTILDTRTDVWAMGCLLYAWWFGYSPFECEFHGDYIRVVECSPLRILGNIPRRSHINHDDQIILELVDWILVKDFNNRPFINDIISRLDEIKEKTNRNNYNEMDRV
eukprot:gene13272-17783_t